MGGPFNADVVQGKYLTGEHGYMILRRRLDSVGDGTGVTNMATVADEYFLAPGTTEDFLVNTMRIIIEDTGDFPWDEFAATGGALANGCVLKIKQANTNGVLTDVHDFGYGADSIKLNADFLSLGNVSLSIDSAGRSILTCDISFKELLGYPLRFQGKEGYRLSFKIQDDLSGLDRMEIWIHGLAGTMRP